MAYVRTETFFASGDLRTASRALVSASDQVNVDSAASAAAYGSLHMRAAVVAGRLGDASTAKNHLREAKLAARNAPEGVYHGTAFGPYSCASTNSPWLWNCATQRVSNVRQRGTHRVTFLRNAARITTSTWAEPN